MDRFNESAKTIAFAFTWVLVQGQLEVLAELPAEVSATVRVLAGLLLMQVFPPRLTWRRLLLASLTTIVLFAALHAIRSMMNGA